MLKCNMFLARMTCLQKTKKSPWKMKQRKTLKRKKVRETWLNSLGLIKMLHLIFQFQ